MDVDMDGDDFVRASHAFVAWLKQTGSTISDSIELADLRQQGAGRGVVANGPIAEDVALFTIPRSAIFSPQTSGLPKDIATEIEDPWLSLILAMVYEFQQGSNSRWRPYYDVLPDNFDTLMFWTNDELTYLNGSAVASKIGRESADKAFKEQLLPVIRNNVDAFGMHEQSDDAILAVCHEMGSTIMAYAFDLETPGSASVKDDEDGWEADSSDGAAIMPKGMVPLADMLNADADRNNAKLFYEEDAVVMRSIKAISAGEEIFNDYGPLPRADVLRRYGYVTENYAQYDVVEIPHDLIVETVRIELSGALKELRLDTKDIKARIAYLDEQGVIDTGYDISRRDSEDGPLPEELSILINTIALSRPDFDILKKKEKLPKPVLTAKEPLQLVQAILLARRAQYGSETAEQDRTTIHDIQSSQDKSDQAVRRRLMALQVIIGEKEVLQEAAGVAGEQLATMAPKSKKRPHATESTLEEKLHLIARGKKSKK